MRRILNGLCLPCALTGTSVAGGPLVRPYAAQRADLAGGPHPKVVVHACADSRVSPELVLDPSPGDPQAPHLLRGRRIGEPLRCLEGVAERSRHRAEQPGGAGAHGHAHAGGQACGVRPEVGVGDRARVKASVRHASAASTPGQSPSRL